MVALAYRNMEPKFAFLEAARYLIAHGFEVMRSEVISGGYIYKTKTPEGLTAYVNQSGVISLAVGHVQKKMEEEQEEALCYGH